jgi:hypothetical protein
VRDRICDAQYPSIAPNYKTATLSVGGWILRDSDGEFAVMVDEEFGERFEPAVAAEPLPAPEPLPYADMSAPGDDVDPTGVVETSHLKVGGTQSDDEPGTPSLSDF